MRRWISDREYRAAAAIAVAIVAASPVQAACPHSDGGGGEDLSVSRTIEIDTSTGPIFGAMTKQAREPSFLKPKEVVLTFDDGPMPWVTKSILDTLDRFCTKATFFSVGKMALAYPGTVKEVLARGHTLGSHTFSHPFNLPHMKAEAAHDEIERGLAAVATAAGMPVAPFFRFTGLSDSAVLLAYLQKRGMATFSVDVVSNDSYISDKQRLIDWTLEEVARNKGGIILFHDIKTTTAKALPEILAALKARGYSVVHLTSKTKAQPLPEMMSAVAPKLAKAVASTSPVKILVPFYGTAGPEPAREISPLDVSALAPQARIRNSVTPARARPSQNVNVAKADKRPSRVLGWAKRAVGKAKGGKPRLVLGSVAKPLPHGQWVTKVKSRPSSSGHKSNP